MTKMPPFSFSSLNKFETCPRWYHKVRVERSVIEPPTEQTEWGTIVHKRLEDRIRDKTPLPKDMEPWESFMPLFDKYPSNTLVEHQMAVDDCLRPCDWDSPLAWSRCIVDVAVRRDRVMSILDWKTSKRIKPTDQLKLSAAIAMCHFPEVEKFKTAFVWLQFNDTTPEDFYQSEKHEIWGSFLPRVRRLEQSYEHDVWPPKPSGLCNGWCPCSDCEHWRPKR